MTKEQSVQPSDYPQNSYPKKNRLLSKILEKFYYSRLHWNKNRIKKLLSFEPKIIEGLDNFYTETQTRKTDYPLRLTEILDTLQKVQPKSIYEMGSGRSSMVFASWARQHNIQYIAFEQLDFWKELTNKILAPISPKEYLVLSGLTEIKNFGGRYKEDISLDADFIYVDGPTIAVENNTTTYLKKNCYTDVAEYLRKGGRPKAIMVEGRSETADLILSEAHKLGLKFKFLPGFHWAIQRNLYKDALAARHHTVFLFD